MQASLDRARTVTATRNLRQGRLAGGCAGAGTQKRQSFKESHPLDPWRFDETPHYVDAACHGQVVASSQFGLDTVELADNMSQTLADTCPKSSLWCLKLDYSRAEVSQ